MTDQNKTELKISKKAKRRGPRGGILTDEENGVKAHVLGDKFAITLNIDGEAFTRTWVRHSPGHWKCGQKGDWYDLTGLPRDDEVQDLIDELEEAESTIMGISDRL